MTTREHTMADGRVVDVLRHDPAARYNVYDCEHGHANLSVDVDEGVTPMFLACRRPGDHGGMCRGSSTSRMYQVGERDVLDLLPVRVLWRRATSGEAKRARRAGDDHYALGGLALEWVA